MSGRLEGSRAIVTGASRGVGRAVATAFAAEGARLVVSATSARALEATLDACRAAGAEATGVALDLADPRSVDAAAAAALAVLERVDVLVNNAGLLGRRGRLADQPPDEFDHVLRVNLAGTVRLTQRVIPSMAHGGAIIMVTSGAAGRPAWGAYSVSKLALEGVTDLLRRELAPAGVRVVAINPGPARTAMRAAAYPDEDPATVPHPSALAEAFLAVAEGADPGPRVEAQ